MARPLKKFTPEDARHWIVILAMKSKDPDFEKNIRVPEGPAALRQRLRDAAFKAQQAMDALYNEHGKVLHDDAPAEMQAWIDEHLSAEGWTRLRASERQRTHQNRINSSEQITKMSRRASSGFSQLAEDLGMTKKDYLSALADWLSFDKEGVRAAKVFAAHAVKAVRPLR